MTRLGLWGADCRLTIVRRKLDTFFDLSMQPMLFVVQVVRLLRCFFICFFFFEVIRFFNGPQTKFL
jgi:hypothetical protein